MCNVSPSSLPRPLPRVRLGLCCINNHLRSQKIYTNRTCTRKTYTQDKGYQLAVQNVRDVLPILKWNETHRIRHMRLSSDMFPHLLDSECQPYELDDGIVSALREAGEFAAAHNHRITMHPGQYNVIGTPRRDVFEATVKDLAQHAYVLDTMNVDSSEGILCIHGGGVYGDKSSTMHRWADQFDELPSNVKQRIAIENCEKGYSIDNCLELSEACNIPVILDTHHYDCYSLYHPDEYVSPIDGSEDSVMPYIVESWSRRRSTQSGSVRPLFHISDPKDLDRSNKQQYCAHHQYISRVPECLMRLVKEDIVQGIDIEVEAKAKEDAIFALLSKMPSEDKVYFSS